MVLAVVAVNAVIAAVLMATPALSRADTPLGVRIPVEQANHSAVASAKRSYQRAVAIIGIAVVFAGGFVASALEPQAAAAIGLAVLPLALIALSLMAMVRSRRGIVAARRSEGWFRDVPGSADDDDRHYWWGLFYVNPDDPALVVEKRVGYGVDFNYGHPVGRAIGVALVLLIVGTVAAVLWLAFAAG